MENSHGFRGSCPLLNPLSRVSTPSLQRLLPSQCHGLGLQESFRDFASTPVSGVLTTPSRALSPHTASRYGEAFQTTRVPRMMPDLVGEETKDQDPILRLIQAFPVVVWSFRKRARYSELHIALGVPGTPVQRLASSGGCV